MGTLHHLFWQEDDIGRVHQGTCISPQIVELLNSLHKIVLYYLPSQFVEETIVSIRPRRLFRGRREDGSSHFLFGDLLV
jgi:hypothetical protein